MPSKTPVFTTESELQAQVQEIQAAKIESRGNVDREHRDSAGYRIRTKQDVDDTALFYIEHKDTVEPLDQAGIKRLDRKNFWFLLSQTWWVAFLIHLDKSTLSQASTMGSFEDVSMTKNEYNDLFVLFYTGYLIALWPGAAIAQKVGHKYFISVSLFLWALLLGMHPLVKTGKQLMALRFLLGMESRASFDLRLTQLTSRRLNLRSYLQPLCSTRPSSLQRSRLGSNSCGGHLEVLRTFSLLWSPTS